jgi:allophanate hydrolase
MLPLFLDLASVRALYQTGAHSPLTLVQAIADRISASPDPAIFITPATRESLVAQAEALLTRAPQPNSLALWGVPFAVKDNIDVAGFPTTAACPAFAYRPEADSYVVQRLREAGAIVIGKTNLDQFATGLNGTRSPYGAPRCVFNSAYISGGSSSGSAVAVAAGLATFALGTDTAGSGRVPAAFNNIVGIKPTPGRISTRGLVPACRSLDVITFFTGCVADGIELRRLAEGFDAADPFSRLGPLTEPVPQPRVGVLAPQHREFYGDTAASELYQQTIERLAELGANVVTFDYTPFQEMAALLYNGPWVAERWAAIEVFATGHRADLDPTVRAIIESAANYSAVDAFRGLYRREELRRATEAVWARVDMLLLPTAPTIYTVDAMREEPVTRNSHLGQYTNFANLLGLAAIAVPAGFRPDGLPFGLTLVGPGGSDEALAPLADALHRSARCGMGLDRAATLRKLPEPEADPRLLPLVVVGAHLTGMPLNGELTRLGGQFLRKTRTSAHYRLFALPGTQPPKPGLIREAGPGGGAIDVEVWGLAPATFAQFVAAIPQPLGIGRIELSDGEKIQGFLCESWALEGAEDITQFGGWRAYMASRTSRSTARA